MSPPTPWGGGEPWGGHRDGGMGGQWGAGWGAAGSAVRWGAVGPCAPATPPLITAWLGWISPPDIL